MRDQDVKMDEAIGLERSTSPNLADTCGAVKLFVAVARISTDAFRFSAIFHGSDVVVEQNSALGPWPHPVSEYESYSGNVG